MSHVGLVCARPKRPENRSITFDEHYEFGRLENAQVPRPLSKQIKPL